MLKVYTSYNCTSCKKVMKWLEEHGIAYSEYNFFGKDLTDHEVRYILMHTTNGFEDIISERSKIYVRNAEVIKDMKTKELIEFIVENPSVLKRPIIVDDVTEMLLVGYNLMEINALI